MMTADETGRLCGRPTGKKTPCQNAAAWPYGCCTTHLTESEKQEIRARQDELKAAAAEREAERKAIQAVDRITAAQVTDIKLAHSIDVTVEPVPGTFWPRYIVDADRWGYGGNKVEPRYAGFRFHWKDDEPIPADPGLIEIRECRREEDMTGTSTWELFGRRDDGSYREGFGKEDGTLAPEWVTDLLPVARKAVGVQSAETDARIMVIRRNQYRRELETEIRRLEDEAKAMENRATWRSERLTEIRAELEGDF